MARDAITARWLFHHIQRGARGPETIGGAVVAPRGDAAKNSGRPFVRGVPPNPRKHKKKPANAFGGLS